jgi:GntR family transcriptional regulator, transcriptional repressor for pyruvate dehydrogenase complex
MSKPLVNRPVKRQTLAEEMAATIKDLILQEELQAGSSLPTEPELARQFGVSRAVVRDATRLLIAWGLIDVKQGLGAFVTSPQNHAFGDALLLALRRNQASVWDVEQFELMLMPEVFALAAEQASEAELALIAEKAIVFEGAFIEHISKWFGVDDVPSAEKDTLRLLILDFRRAVMFATHNRLIQQLAEPLLRLYNLRYWEDQPGASPQAAIDEEIQPMRKLIQAMKTRDTTAIRVQWRDMMKLPAHAVETMQRTRVGDIPIIPYQEP